MPTTATIYVDLEGPECEGHELPELEIQVTGTVEPYVPARRSGHPDTWCPSEGGEVVDVAATLDGEAFELTGALLEKAEEALTEAAAENTRSWEPEREDFERDYEDEAYC